MVKISVSHEGEEDNQPKVSDRKPAMKKPVRKKPRPTSLGSASSASAGRRDKRIVKKANIKKKKHESGGLKQLLVAVFITALIVGGGIYAWQKSSGTKIITNARKEALVTKMSFEERLANLKSKLTGVETENVELKERSEELTRRVELLNKAKIDFVDEELGLAFTYPALFGEIVITKTEIASGTKYLCTFTDNDKLIFGGVSTRFELPRSQATATLAVIDTLGFSKKWRGYYWLGPGEREHEINPVEVIKLDGGEALLVDRNSFEIDSEEDELPVDIGENVAVVFNLDNKDFPGLAFLNQDFGMLPLESYKEMISTIKIIK